MSNLRKSAVLLVGLALLGLLLFFAPRLRPGSESARSGAEPATTSLAADPVPATPRKPELRGATSEQIRAALKPAKPVKLPPGGDPLDQVTMAIRALPPGRAASYVANDRNVNVFFGPRGEITTSIGEDPRRRTSRGEHRNQWVQWSPVAGREADPRAAKELPGRVNNFVGDASTWTQDQKTYGAVVWDEIRPGVELSVEAKSHGYKYTMKAAPGADLGNLRFRYRGAQNVQVANDGASLQVRMAEGNLLENGLVVYQDAPGGRQAVEAHYVSLDNETYEIVLGAYNPELTLTIDPAVGWSSYLGGTQTPGGDYDQAYGIAVDSSGNIYIGGTTQSPNFPVTQLDTSMGGYSDSFVIKINTATNPNTIAWCTFLGGAQGDYLTGLVIDGASPPNVYVTGSTDSQDFPNSLGNPVWNNGDSFVTKINGNGLSLGYSRFLGGSSSDYANKIAIDGSGNVYVAGTTYSSDFPIVGGFDPAFKGSGDGFIAKLDTAATLVWSTFLGGSDYETIKGLAVDGSGNIYVGGYTYSTDFHVFNWYRNFNTGGSDCFVAKINSAVLPALPTLAWSTYIGSSGYDNFEGLAVDASGNVYFTGTTYSNAVQYPTLNFYSNALSGSYDHCFVSKFATGGGPGSLLWSTFIGGSFTDHPMAIAVDGANAIIVGYTESSNYPTTPILPTPAYDRTHNGGYDVFVTKFNGTPSLGLLFSTFVGGNSDDVPFGMALDTASPPNIYVTGYTYSTNFPTTANALRPLISGNNDAFGFRLAGNGLTLPGCSYLGGSTSVGNENGGDVAVDNAGNLYVTGYTYSSDFPIAGSIIGLQLSFAQRGSADVTVTKYVPNGSSYTMSSSFYLGGTFSSEYPYGIAVDGAGTAVFVTGYTYSSDFPVTTGPIMSGGNDVFVTRINYTGSTASMGYSRFLGGSSYEYGQAIAVDSLLNAYVTGYTNSTDFPGMIGGQSAQTVKGTYEDIFVTKLSPAGAITWSTYLGGDDTDVGYAIKVDGPNGNVYIGGYSYSASGYPTFGSPYQGTKDTYSDGVITKLNPTGGFTFGSSYSTFLGGNDSDYINDLALDSAVPPNVYVTGYTYSNNFPTPGGAYTSMVQRPDVFVTKLNQTGSSVVWGTFLGGSDYEYGQKLRVDANGSVYVAGLTYSYDFPMKNAFDGTFNGSADIFACRINQPTPSTMTVAWSSFLGGSNYETLRGLALNSNGALILVGDTSSADFPKVSALDAVLNGQDMFVTRIDNSDPLTPSISGQFRKGNGNPIAIGGWTNETQITIKATIGDSDEDQVKLQIEFKAKDVLFDGTGLVESGLVASGTLVSYDLTLPLTGTQEWHWRARTVDSLGRASAWVAFGGNTDSPLPAARDVGKDSVAPVVAFVTPTTLTTWTTPSSPLSVTGTATETTSNVVSVTWSYNGSIPALATGTTSWSIGSIPLTLGQFILTVSATDGAGNIGTANMTITYDTSAPTSVAITSPVPPVRTGASSIGVNGTANDNWAIASVTWTTDRGASGTAVVTHNGPAGLPPANQDQTTWSTTVALSPGVNNLTVKATDGGGLFTTTTLAIFYDNVAPNLTIGSPANGTIFSGPAGSTIPVSGTASDPSGGTIASIGYSNSASPPPGAGVYGPGTNWSATVPLQGGANPITITATDGQGNGTGAGITVYLDTQNPAVTISVPTVNPTYTTGSGSITIGGTATDDLQVASVSWVNDQGGSGSSSNLTGPPNSKSWSVLVTGLSSINPNVITVTTTDAVGKIGTDVITITYDTNAPAIIVTNPPTANHVTSTTPITVTGSATDAGLGVVSTITVRNLKTGVYSTVTATLPSNNVNPWSAPVDLVIGDNTIEIVATDDTMLATTVTITITLDPNPPAVTITGPTGADTYVSGVGTIGLSGVASDNAGVTKVTFSRNPVLVAPPAFFDATLSGPPTACTWNVPSIPLVAGVPNIITVTATDAAGNTATDTLTVTFDTTSPGITITSPTSAPTLMTTVSPQPISGVASDVGSTIQSVTWSLTNAGGNTSGSASITPSGGFFTWSAGNVALQPGANVFDVIATDAAGNTQSDSITIFLDNLKPTVLITSPTPNPSMSTTAATISLGGLAGDNIQLQSVNWTCTSSPSAPRNGTAVGTTFWSTLPISLDPGDNVITVTAVDAAGNVSDPKTLTVSYDNSGPLVTVNTPSGVTTSTTTTPAFMDGTASDNIGVVSVTWVNLSTGGVGTASGTDNWSAFCPLTSGDNVIHVTATDAAGNSTTVIRTITYDPAAPFITIVGPTTGVSFTTGDTPITITGTADDDIGVTGITWVSDAPGIVGGNATPIPGTNGWTAGVQLVPGSQVLTFTATDGVLRTGTTRITLIYDPVNPQVTISTPSNQAIYLSKVTPINLGGIAIDNLGLQDVKWVNAQTGENGTTQGVGVWTIPVVNLQQGPNDITVTATDGVGNTGSAPITVIYDGFAPTVSITDVGPSVIPQPAPYAPVVTQTRPMIISGTAGDNLNLTKVTWTNSLGGGGDATLTFTTPGTAATWAIDPVVPAGGNGVYFVPGDNIITVTAEDAHGQTTSIAITVQYSLEPGPPTINITSPVILTSATQVAALAGTANDTVGVVSVTWRNMTTGVRGSAATLTGPITARDWTANVPLTNGSNVIVLTATDDAGNTATATITLTYATPADIVTPSVSVTGPSLTDPWTTTPIPVTLDADDDTGIATLIWTNSKTGGAGVATYVGGTTWSASIALGPGVNTLTFTAYDAAGNSATDQIVVNFLNTSLDVTPPLVAIVPTPTGVVNTAVALLSLTGTASDLGGGSVAEVIWSNAATAGSASMEGTTAWTGPVLLTPGLNLISVVAYDDHGNVSAAAQVTVNYSPPAPVIPAGHCGLLGLEGLLLVALIRRLARRR